MSKDSEVVLPNDHLMTLHATEPGGYECPTLPFLKPLKSGEGGGGTTA